MRGIKYTWPITNTDAVNQAADREGNLADVVYVSDNYQDMSVAQAIALIRKVYMDPQVPGIWYRGYTADSPTTNYGSGQKEGSVMYQGVGQISCDVTVSQSGNTYTYNYSSSWADTYGWNIPGAIASNLRDQQSTSGGLFNRRIYNYKTGTQYFEQNQYKPEHEGYTLLLIEVKGSYDAQSAYPTQGSTPYENLCRYFAQAIKSVRIVGESVRVNEGAPNAGTLFKIDADDLDKFFFISKGQARSYYNNSSLWHPYLNVTYSTTDNNPGTTYYDMEANSGNIATNMFPFYHMFEQFSPSEGTDGSTLADVLLNMKKGITPPVVHDCIAVLTAEGKGHGFKMSGNDGQTENVKDLMFLIPDRRMTDWESGNKGRETSSKQKFINYNNVYAGYQPITGAYSIQLDGTASKTDIHVPEATDDQAMYYKIDLHWNSNLYKFLPEHQQEFKLYYVTYVNGEEVRMPVKKWDDETQSFTNEDVVFVKEASSSNITHSYTDYVPMLEYGQEVTYIVVGRDMDANDKSFLSLQPSNTRTFFISGYDPHELLELAIDANYWSTYDANNEKNNYTNEIPMRNSSGDTRVTSNFLSMGTVFTFKRKASKEDGGIDIATAEVEALSLPQGTSNGSCTFKIKMLNQNDFDGAKYIKNGTIEGGSVECTIYAVAGTVDNKYHVKDEVDFSDFVIYDNFSVTPDNIVTNGHLDEYVYQVSFEAATEFVEGSNNKKVYSNMPVVPVYKTGMETSVGGYNETQVKEDEKLYLTALKVDKQGNTILDYQVKVSKYSDQLVHQYRNYMWGNDVVSRVQNDESQMSYAQNQNSSYRITPEAKGNNDGADKAVILVNDNMPSWGKFIEPFSGAGEFVMVPVVDSYARDKSHNTYGAPITPIAIGKLNVSVMEPFYESKDADYSLMSNYKWQKDDKWYSYYNIYLDIKDLQVPTGYEIYKLRAWRKVEGFTGTVEDNNRTQVDNILDECLDTRLPRTITFDTGDEDLGAGWYMYEDMNFGNNLDVDGLTTMKLSTLTPNGTNYFIIGDRSTKIVKPDGEKLFADQTGDWAYGDSQNDAIRNEKRATFGALRLKTSDGDQFGTLDELNAQFVVRVYFTKVSDSRQNGPRKAEAEQLVSLDGKYYIAEYKCEYNALASKGIITGVMGINPDRQAQSVMYYNAMGLPSVTPWQGVNIVVTRYTDGTTTTAKVVR